MKSPCRVALCVPHGKLLLAIPLHTQPGGVKPPCRVAVCFPLGRLLLAIPLHSQPGDEVTLSCCFVCSSWKAVISDSATHTTVGVKPPCCVAVCFPQGRLLLAIPLHTQPGG